MSEKIKTDIGVIGGGVTGLMVTEKLAKIGYDVTLIDKSSTIANGPSIRNQGWLHRGTYHASMLKDPQTAMDVAQRIAYGHEQIRSYAPEAIEAPFNPMFTMIRSNEIEEQAVSRWNEADIPYHPVSLGRFSALNPEVNMKGINSVYKVGDLTLNNRIFYQKLLAQSVKNGARVYSNTDFVPVDDQNAELYIQGQGKFTLQADMFVVTTGFGMRDIFKHAVGEDLPMRYWQSHMLVFPRLTKHGVFDLHAMGSTIVNHGNTTVAGLHEDAVMLDDPCFDVNPDKARDVYDATQGLIPRAKEYSHSYMSLACVKPDVAQMASSARSVGVQIFEPVSNYIFALPGKMTEAPYVADSIVQMTFDRNSPHNITLRPCDMFMLKSGSTPETI